MLPPMSLDISSEVRVLTICCVTLSICWEYSVSEGYAFANLVRGTVITNIIEIAINPVFNMTFSVWFIIPHQPKFVTIPSMSTF